jgi:hypothetical protein
MDLRLQLPEEALEAIARRAAELVLEQLAETGGAGEWLTVPEAAAFLRCEPQRIYTLRSTGRLPRHVEGGRALVARSDLLRLVVDEDALSPAERARIVA